MLTVAYDALCELITRINFVRNANEWDNLILEVNEILKTVKIYLNEESEFKELCKRLDNFLLKVARTQTRSGELNSRVVENCRDCLSDICSFIGSKLSEKIKGVLPQ